MVSQLPTQVFLAPQDALEVMFVTQWSFIDLTDVTLVSEDTFADEEDEEVKRSDGLWRFACGDVSIWSQINGAC